MSVSALGGSAASAGRRIHPVVLIALQFAAVTYLTAASSLLFWSHAPELIGWHPRVVLTGSMLPVIQPGDVAVIGPAAAGPASLPRGRIVLVRDPLLRSGFYLHRVLRYDDRGRVVTKGDANRTADSDPVAAERVLGQLRLLVPVVGRPVVWLQDRAFLPLTAVGLATWAALAVIVTGGGRSGPLRGSRRQGRRQRFVAAR